MQSPPQTPQSPAEQNLSTIQQNAGEHRAQERFHRDATKALDGVLKYHRDLAEVHATEATKLEAQFPYAQQAIASEYQAAAEEAARLEAERQREEAETLAAEAARIEAEKLAVSGNGQEPDASLQPTEGPIEPEPPAEPTPIAGKRKAV